VFICFPGQDDGVPCDLGCAILDGYNRYEEKRAMLLDLDDNLDPAINKFEP
jgi:hypothetical protein